MLKIVVETWNRGTKENSHTVDHDNREDRVWMGRHCYWAFRNGREIRTYAEQPSAGENGKAKG